MSLYQGDKPLSQNLKHAERHASGGSDPITPGSIGTYSSSELDGFLEGKASTSHASTHTSDGTDPITLGIEQIENLQSTLNGKANSGDVYTKTESDLLLSKKSNENLLDNWYFGNPVDQRQKRVVIPNTTYYSDNQLTTSAGTTSAYVKAHRYATGTASGVSYASFKLTDTDAAPTYYAAPENVVRGCAGVRPVSMC